MKNNIRNFLLFFILFFSYSNKTYATITYPTQGSISFGEVISGTVDSNIRVKVRDGTIRVVSGDVTSIEGTSSYGNFIINCDPGETLEIIIDGPSFIDSMSLSNWDYEFISNCNKSNKNTGTCEVNVGLDALIPVSQTEGSYSGSYRIGIRYAGDITYTYSNYQSVEIDITSSSTPSIGQIIAMDFGSIYVDGTNSEVNLDDKGNITNVVGNAVFAGNTSAGEFEVYGTPGQTVFLTVSTGDVLTSGSNEIQLTSLVDDQAGSFALKNSGSQTVIFGANLVIPAGQVGGYYTGTYTVNVNY